MDNLHEYLRFSFPKLCPPSFVCDNETSKGLRLTYRSKRKWFVYYAMGQISEVCCFNTYSFFFVIKSTEGEQPVGDIPYSLVYMSVQVSVYVCFTPPDETKNDTDMNTFLFLKNDPEGR